MMLGARRLAKGTKIHLSVVSSFAATVDVLVDLLLDNGRLTQLEIPQFTTGSDRTEETRFSTERLNQDAWVTYARVRTTSTMKRGQTLVRLDPAICAGYLYQGKQLVLGEFVESGPSGGHGFIRSIDLGNPAANTDYTSQTVPTNAVWKIRGFSGALVQGITQTPKPTIVVTDGTNAVFRATRMGVQAVSETVTYGLLEGGYHPSTSSFSSPEDFIYGAFSRRIFPEGYVVTFPTVGKGANTDWGAGRLLVEEWVVI